jgi:uncharacterized protein (TIGR02246 family)
MRHVTMKTFATLAAVGFAGAVIISPAAHAATPAPLLANSTKCVYLSEAKIAALFDRWNKSLATGDPEKVANNYAKDSVLLPTLSEDIRVTRDSKVDYFVDFLAKKPTGEIIDRHTKSGCNMAVDSGNYDFTFGNGSKAEARYTYVYALEGGKWKIVSHHSSVKP